MSQTNFTVRRADVRIVDGSDSEDEDEAVHCDWEIRNDKKRYLHKRGDSLGYGWIQREVHTTINIYEAQLLKWLKNAVKNELSRYPDGKLVHLPSGFIRLDYKGHVWLREGSIGHKWSKLIIGDDKKEWRPVPKEHWDTLNQTVSQLVAAEPTDAPAPASNIAAQQDATSQKKNKHGILQIVSSAGPSHKKYSFGYGCWVSKKYPGKFSILLGIAGKRYMYTISKKALEAKILMEQKALRRAAEKDPT